MAGIFFLPQYYDKFFQQLDQHKKTSKVYSRTEHSFLENFECISVSSASFTAKTKIIKHNYKHNYV